MAWEGVFAFTGVLMAGFVIARAVTQNLSAARTSTVDLVCLFLAYGALQGLGTSTVARLFPGGG